MTDSCIAPLEDGISSLRWSPVANFLTATCWDGKVYLWEVQSATQAAARACQPLEGPALCSTWSADGNQVFYGGCTNVAKMWDIPTGTVTPVAKHDDTIRHMVFLPSLNLLLTGSWDKTIRYWDVRAATGTPVHTAPIGERVYCLDAMSSLCVVSSAARQVVVYDLRNPAAEFRRGESPLKYQSRSIACFTDLSGYAIGSIEGRVSIQSFDGNANSTFTFKCHRQGPQSKEVYAVNDIHFNTLGTFATVGSDGVCHFWDKDSRQRLKQFNRHATSISCCRFSAQSNLFAYAASYDWSKGISGAGTAKNQIFIHDVKESEVKPKPKTGVR